MTLIQSEIRKSLLLLMLCTFVACIGFTAGMLSGIVSARLLAGLFAVYIVVSGIWFYSRLRRILAAQRTTDELPGTRSRASEEIEPASEPTPNGVPPVGWMKTLGYWIGLGYNAWCAVGFVWLIVWVIDQVVTGQQGRWMLICIPFYAILSWSFYKLFRFFLKKIIGVERAAGTDEFTA
jgi:uncharacterized membrane protein YfcA